MLIVRNQLVDLGNILGPAHGRTLTLVPFRYVFLCVKKVEDSGEDC